MSVKVDNCFGNNWWLRSPGNNSNNAAIVNNNGNVNGNGNNVDNNNSVRQDSFIFETNAQRQIKKPETPLLNSGSVQESNEGVSSHGYNHSGDFGYEYWWSLAKSQINERFSGQSHLLFQKFIDFKSLHKAHKKAGRCKRHKKDVSLFEKNMLSELEKLRRLLVSNTYKIDGYYKFTITDPKKREVQALEYKHRVVMHSLCDNVLTPYFEGVFLNENAACRNYKGTNYALNLMRQNLTNIRLEDSSASVYALKCDIKKYFSSINHQILCEILKPHAKVFGHKISVIVRKIIDSYYDEERSVNNNLVGLPMGNQTSQIFALLYLHPLDYFIKNALGIKYYIRYMDDFILLHHNKEYLQNCLKEITFFLANFLRLELNQKTQIITVNKGLKF